MPAYDPDHKGNANATERARRTLQYQARMRRAARRQASRNHYPHTLGGKDFNWPLKNRHGKYEAGRMLKPDRRI